MEKKMKAFEAGKRAYKAVKEQLKQLDQHEENVLEKVFEQIGKAADLGCVKALVDIEIICGIVEVPQNSDLRGKIFWNISRTLTSDESCFKIDPSSDGLTMIISWEEQFQFAKKTDEENRK
jgi:tetrahydromethanopterin S-methyltransferase subunit G